MRRSLTETLLLVTAGAAVTLAVVGLFKGVEAPLWLAVSVTFGLVFFAGVQLFRDDRRAQREQNALRHRLHALARLVRRNCEAAMSSRQFFTDHHLWAVSVSSAPGYVTWESDFMELQALGGQVGEPDASATHEALGAFFDAADLINRVADEMVTQSPADQRTDCAKAVEHLRKAVAQLQPITERRAIPPQI